MRYPLTLSLRPSRAVMASILAVHVAAGLALFHVPSLSLLQPGPAWQPLRMLGVALWGGVLVSLLRAIRAERAKHGQALTLHSDGGLSVAGGEGVADYWIGPDAVDFGWVVWLPLFDPVSEVAPPFRRTRGRLMLLRANVFPQHWRPLRIWLRHKAAPVDQSWQPITASSTSRTRWGAPPDGSGSLRPS